MSDSEKNKTTALVIDDEPQIRRLLRVTLEANGYQVVDAASGQEGLVQAAQCRPNVIVLDLGLPDMDGISVLKRLREWSRAPVIILRRAGSRRGKGRRLGCRGADDYGDQALRLGRTRFFARLRVALRHSEEHLAEEPIFHSGTILVVDLTGSARHRGGQGSFAFTVTEYNLLRLLVRHAGKVLTHRFLLREIWGPNAENQNHYLRVCMCGAAA